MEAPLDDRAFLGHPKGLGYLAFTEVWERFSYYGMQSLLVLYMAKQLLLPGHVENIAFFGDFRKLYGGLQGPALASAIFGTYTALVYFTPTLGGLIADKWLGKRLTVLAGALMMALGHFLMAFEVSFLFALLALVIGSGLFKGNLASQIASLYKPDDLRRADAFQIYYLALLIGQPPSTTSIPPLLLRNIAAAAERACRVLVRRALFRIQRGRKGPHGSGVEARAMHVDVGLPGATSQAFERGPAGAGHRQDIVLPRSKICTSPHPLRRGSPFG